MAHTIEDVINEFTSLIIISVDCGLPVAPRNGSLESYTITTEGSEVFYSCNQGLVPERRMRTVCTNSGWSPNPAELSCILGNFQLMMVCALCVMNDLVICERDEIQ